MVLTQSQIRDIKLIIQQTITELLTDKTFIEGIAVKVAETLNLQEIEKRTVDCEKQITELMEVNKTLQARMESFERYSKRNNLRIYGVREKVNGNEDIVDTLRRETKLQFEEEKIECAYRIGKATKEGNRAIFIKFKEQKHKMEIVAERKLLKGTQIIITEDLTKLKHEVLKDAVAKLGKKNVWCMNGKILYRNGNVKHSIRSMEDIEKLIS